MTLPLLQLEVYHTQKYRRTTAETRHCTMAQRVQCMMIQVRTTMSKIDQVNGTKRERGIFSFRRQRGRASRISCNTKYGYGTNWEIIGQLEPLNLAAGKLDFDGIDPEIGMHLLSIYWSRQLYTAQIIYRPAFMRDMACEGPYFSKLLLNAIFFVVSKHCDRPELRSDPNDITTAGWKFRQRFTQLLRDCFDKSEITTLQALLIMSNALFSRCDERSLSWLYAGNAFNMFIDLGLHVLPAVDSIPAEELEIRKRVLWGAYCELSLPCTGYCPPYNL